jgi:multidrug resistance efflux pump
MPEPATIPPARRPELMLRPLGEDGQHVVKDPATGAYYNLGEVESFLLTQLDGRQTTADICAAFAARFGEEFSGEDLDEFLKLALSQGFLQAAAAPAAAGPATAAPAAAPAANSLSAKRAVQSLLYWRRSVFDPDRLFNWLVPKVTFFWTRAFVICSALVIVLAGLVALVNGRELVGYLPSAVRWETLALGWVTLFVVTTAHEFAHGMTCKRFGGEVHEVGFLLMFFMPCFYCNVSDAWLIREKSRRLWVTLAGGYCDLCVWALSVFVWRLAQPGTTVHHLAWVVLSVCGFRVLLNFNPLLKLDGYYVVSDWLEIPNLRQRALERVAAHVRWLAWGAPRPAPEARGRLLLVFGLTSWAFSVFYVTLMMVGLSHFLGGRLGQPGVAAVGVLGWIILPGLFSGFNGGEVLKMFLKRHKRLVIIGAVLGVAGALLWLVQPEDQANGNFKVRPVTRAELRAPVSGFLRAVYADDNGPVSGGAVVACLEVPDLESKLAQKQAEVREARAKLKLLEAGPRPEEVLEQRLRVQRATGWRDQARQDLERRRKAHQADQAKLHELVGQRQAEATAAHDAFQRAKRLLGKSSLSPELYREAEKHHLVTMAQLAQALAEQRASEAVGTLEAEAELGRREKELADVRATLTIQEAGTRPEEIEAERARLARLVEESRYLELLRTRERLYSPVSGVVVTPRLREKIGQFFKEGDLICEVEDLTSLEVEIALDEEEVARVRAGQRVELKARALPFEVFHAQVDRMAPTAVKAESPQSKTDGPTTVTLYCRLEDASSDLRPGMTGYARVYCGHRPLGEIWGRKVLRFFRTEFWW